METTPNGLIAALIGKWSSARGKTLVSVTEESVPQGFCGDYLVFRFSDGSAAIMPSGDRGYTNILETFSDGYTSNDCAKAYFGLVPIADYLAKERKREDRYEAETVSREKAELRRLTNKYGVKV